MMGSISVKMALVTLLEARPRCTSQRSRCRAMSQAYSENEMMKTALNRHLQTRRKMVETMRWSYFCSKGLETWSKKQHRVRPFGAGKPL
ncbi:hypothetical protein KC19_2G056800 [Ceratodon purpureus]|uniref:Uncharacterized protein n=1 Tax=Ceratodon purpureus TaxID=3225 RepID=A0A8T0ISI4_CERPU|nr:hypothetical protein KC19_2G056800 [Ceratodon purpureus]